MSVYSYKIIIGMAVIAVTLLVLAAKFGLEHNVFALLVFILMGECAYNV